MSLMVAMTLIRLCGAIAFSIIFDVSGAIAQGIVPDSTDTFSVGIGANGMLDDLVVFRRLAGGNDRLATGIPNDSWALSILSGQSVYTDANVGDAIFDMSTPNEGELIAVTDDSEVIVIDFINSDSENKNPLVRYFDSRNTISLSSNYGVTNDDLGGGTSTRVNLSLPSEAAPLAGPALNEDPNVFAGWGREYCRSR